MTINFFLIIDCTCSTGIEGIEGDQLKVKAKLSLRKKSNNNLNIA